MTQIWRPYCRGLGGDGNTAITRTEAEVLLTINVRTADVSPSIHSDLLPLIDRVA